MKVSGSVKSRSNSNIRRNDVSIPSSSAFLPTPLFLSSFSPFCNPTYARVQIFFFPSIFSLFTSCHALLPFRLFFFSFFLSSFFFSIEFLYSLHSVVLNLRPSLDVSTRGLYCARLCPDNPSHPLYTRLRSYRGIKFDSSICT